MTLFVFLGRTALTIFQNFKNLQPFYMTVILGSANFDQKKNSEMEVQPVNDLANEDDMNEAGILTGKSQTTTEESVCSEVKRTGHERHQNGQWRMHDKSCNLFITASSIFMFLLNFLF